MYLPHELIVQILMRLPVKFLIRFRCVCKLWFSLISDPHFANSHFQLTSATNTHRIVSISTRSDEIPSIDFDAFLNDDPASAILNFSLPESYFPYEIRGSCRGFILLYHHPDIYIWNPCTGFKTQIPVSPFRSKLAAHCRVHIHGFGYDQSRDDYLVVSLSYDPTLANDVSTHLKFFSFRDNTWKETESNHFPYAVAPYHRKGWLFNEAIHWLALRRDLGRKVIIAFDLRERKFFEMPLPSDLGHLSNSSLWVFGEFLSQCARNYDNDTVEIWVMKEYKVHSSWTKTLVLSVDAIADHYFQPIYYTKNGNIIGRNHGTKLMKYDDKGQLLRHRPFSNCPSFYNCPSEVVVYMESLLSLPGDSEQV